MFQSISNEILAAPIVIGQYIITPKYFFLSFAIMRAISYKETFVSHIRNPFFELIKIDNFDNFHILQISIAIIDCKLLAIRFLNIFLLNIFHKFNPSLTYWVGTTHKIILTL